MPSIVNSRALSSYASRLLACLVVASCLAALVLALPTRATADPPGLRPNDASPVAEWNALAVNTFLGDTTKSPVEAGLYVAFVQAAVYDAVVGIQGKFEPYAFTAKPARPASAQAAAIAAAHRILVTYSPYAQSSLDTAMATSLARLRSGKALDNGVDYGQAVADNLIALRSNDGRNAPITFSEPPSSWCLASDTHREPAIRRALDGRRHPSPSRQRFAVRRSRTSTVTGFR